MSPTASRLPRVVVLLLVVAACLVAASVDVVRGRRFRLVDDGGAPLAGAFVSVELSAGTKLISPWAYHEGPLLGRTDRDGAIRLPGKVLLRFPLVTWSSPVRLHVSAYAPPLHAACTVFDPDAQDSWCVGKLDRSGDEPAFRIRDQGGDPVRRFWSLWLLLHGFVSPGTADPAIERELTAAVRAEYEAFLEEFGEVPFANTPGEWGRIPVGDWTREPDVNRQWRFFLREVPFYGSTLEEKVVRLEAAER